MIKPFSSILFATNLSENCVKAFDYVVSLAVRYQASIVLLYVIEQMPKSVEGTLKDLLGEKKWKEFSKSHEDSARQTLIGKRASNHIIRAALGQFCSDAGIDNAECGYISREIVVRNGEAVQEILKQTEAYNCDLIVMGARQSFISKDATVGNVIKSVIHKAKVPVLVVPPKI